MRAVTELLQGQSKLISRKPGTGLTHFLLAVEMTTRTIGEDQLYQSVSLI
jgi:hypothetical protein